MEIIILFIILGIVFFVITGFCIAKDEYDGGVALLVVGLAVISLTFYSIYKEGKIDGYKEGQVDAINHKIYYKLVTKTDSTKVWEQKK